MVCLGRHSRWLCRRPGSGASSSRAVTVVVPVMTDGNSRISHFADLAVGPINRDSSIGSMTFPPLPIGKRIAGECIIWQAVMDPCALR